MQKIVKQCLDSFKVPLVSSKFPIFSSHIKQRYLANSYEELIKRVNKTVNLDADIFQKQFFEKMIKTNFIPAGNTLLAGKKEIHPNCVVLGEITDDNELEMIERAISLWENATGVGVNINTSDPIGTLFKLSKENDMIDLKHRPKRGNMATIDVDNDHLKDIIWAKNKIKSGGVVEGKIGSYSAMKNPLYNFNISVLVPDDFMEKIIKNDDCMDEIDVLMDISKCAMLSGEPGLIFVDRVQGNEELCKVFGSIKCAVPCGEQFLHASESCNLGTINLNSPWILQEKGNGFEFNMNEFKESVSVGVAFLDCIVDKLQIEDKRISKMNQTMRRIGLGITGLADCFEKLGMNYGSNESVEFSSMIAETLKDVSIETSIELANMYGGLNLPIEDDNELKKRRNLSINCLAPTGGLSTMLNNRGFGIEPFVESDVNPINHLRILEAFQNHIEQSISKTINIKRECNEKDIFKLFLKAFEMNTKCITVYVDSKSVLKCYDC